MEVFKLALQANIGTKYNKYFSGEAIDELKRCPWSAFGHRYTLQILYNYSKTSSNWASI